MANEQFKAELRALLEKWDCYISCECKRARYGFCQEELSICRSGDDSVLFTTNDVCGSTGWGIGANDLA